MFISVVVPCLNEESVLEETNQRLLQALDNLRGHEAEVLYVDDGSSDTTPQILARLTGQDRRVRAVILSRNFGHQAALTAGLEHTRGDAVVVIDADLQDPPELISEMVSLWRQGAQVVYGTRTERAGESSFKTMTAKGFYRILNRLSDVKIPLDTGDFRLMDRQVVDAFLSLPERHRFVRGMVSWLGYRQEPLPYKRDPRAAGETKYSVRKMLKFALDGIASFSLVPLRLVTAFGFLASGLAMLGIVYALIARIFTNDWVPGWAAIFITTLFMGGVQLISMGIIGEYIGRIYGEVKGRPIYLVQDRLGFDSTPRQDGAPSRSQVSEVSVPDTPKIGPS